VAITALCITESHIEGSVIAWLFFNCVCALSKCLRLRQTAIAIFGCTDLVTEFLNIQDLQLGLVYRIVV
jgi:hypothetical protein